MICLYVLSTSIILISASGFLYLALITILDKEDEYFLASRIHVLNSLLQEQPESRDALEHVITEEIVGFSGSQYRTYSRILNEDGHTLFESPSMIHEIPTDVFPEPDKSSHKTKKWRSTKNRIYHLTAIWSENAVTTQPKWKIQVALDESGEYILIHQYERYLIVVLLVGILMSAAVGIITARRGMKPLTDIARVAKRITANQLHERITASRWPQELTSLACAFDDMLGRLEDSFNRISQFSADLAHELRTPINNLRGETEVALSRPRNNDDYREILSSSLEEYDRLSRMIDSLLFLAKADATQTVITSSSIDARVEIEKLISFYEALAEEQEIRITCEGDSILEVDPILFHRAISNLLSNALRYTSSGGKITFSICSVVGTGTEILCSDTGMGIAQEHLPKIFDRFYQVDSSRNRKAGGAGLGLAIVKSIINLHSGDITIQSIIGEGTSIRLFFPNRSLLQASKPSIIPLDS